MEVRIDEPTPNGGAYSIAFYTNEAGDDCSVDEATLIHIHEYSASGERISETYGMCSKKQDSVR